VIGHGQIVTLTEDHIARIESAKCEEHEDYETVPKNKLISWLREHVGNRVFLVSW
jgi:hypothetical protein